MKIKKELNLVDYFQANAKAYLEKNKDQTKFAYALNRMLKRIDQSECMEKITVLRNEYVEKQTDAKTLLCAVDDKGHLMLTEKGMHIFTPENEIKARHEHNRLNKEFAAELKKLSKTLVEIEPFFVDEKEVPKDLSFDEQEYFAGFVIQETIEK